MWKIICKIKKIDKWMIYMLKANGNYDALRMKHGRFTAMGLLGKLDHINLKKKRADF